GRVQIAGIGVQRIHQPMQSPVRNLGQVGGGNVLVVDVLIDLHHDAQLFERTGSIILPVGVAYRARQQRGGHKQGNNKHRKAGFARHEKVIRSRPNCPQYTSAEPPAAATYRPAPPRPQGPLRPPNPVFPDSQHLPHPTHRPAPLPPQGPCRPHSPPFPSPRPTPSTGPSPVIQPR